MYDMLSWNLNEIKLFWKYIFRNWEILSHHGYGMKTYIFCIPTQAWGMYTVVCISIIIKKRGVNATITHPSLLFVQFALEIFMWTFASARKSTQVVVVLQYLLQILLGKTNACCQRFDFYNNCKNRQYLQKKKMWFWK